MARDSLPRCALIRARFPIPKSSSCQMSWMLTSSRPVHWLRLLLGPRPKIPPWINMPALWKPLSMTTGRSGRAFSRRIPASAAWTSARREASSGRLVRAIGIRSSSGRPGSIRVIWAWSCSSGSTTARGSSRSTWVRLALCDPPLLPRRDGPLLEVGEHVPGPVDLDLGDQLLAQLRDPLDQVAAPLDGVEGAGVHPPVLVHPEVGVGGLEQGVVLGGLDVPVPGVQDLPRDQGLEDGVGQVDVLIQAGTGVEEVDARRGHDALVEVRAAAVVADVVDAEHDRGDPEDLGPRELGLGHPDAGLRGGHDQRPGVGEPQGGGEVDREAEVGRLQRRRLQRHAGGEG